VYFQPVTLLVIKKLGLSVLQMYPSSRVSLMEDHVFFKQDQSQGDVLGISCPLSC